MKILATAIYKLYYSFTEGFYRVLIHPFRKKLFRSCGNNVHISKGGSFTYPTILIGSHVYIGPEACFRNETCIEIGNYVMFGPSVTILGSNHAFEEPGIYMRYSGRQKRSQSTAVCIADDVWIGAGAKIMGGCCVGKGCVIAAGAIVTKNCEPYGVYAGVPAKRIKDRFSVEQIKIHEEKLGIV